MKVLIIRFSSLGDVLQTLSVLGRLAEAYPHAEIHWVTRQEYTELIATHPGLTRVWGLARRSSFKDLLRLGFELKRQNFTHVYDAHNNLRSHILGWQLQGFLGWRRWFGSLHFLRRSLYRFRRFLLFKFHVNLYPQPFTGQFALLDPLKKWGLSIESPKVPQLFLKASAEPSLSRKVPFDKFVALAPSAAYPLKRWPLPHWLKLIELLPELNFAVLGGPEDVFLEELAQTHPGRVLNLAGKISLVESAMVVNRAQALVSNDTGLMHVAEQLGRPCVALMGPAPFGYPCREKTEVLELNLSCRPCSKHGQGPCVNPEFQKCLNDISPVTVAKHLRGLIHA